MSNSKYQRLKDTNVSDGEESSEGGCWDYFFRKRKNHAEGGDDNDQNDETMTVIHNLRQFLNKIPPKLNEMKRRKENAELSAYQFLRQNDREGAKRKASLAMRFKRINERWRQFETTIENVILTYEEAIMAKTMFDVLGMSQQALDTLMNSISEEKVVELMNRLNEKPQVVGEKSDIWAESTYYLHYIDDEEIEAELNRLEKDIEEKKKEKNNNDNNNNDTDVYQKGSILTKTKNKNTKKTEMKSGSNKTSKAKEKRKKIVL